jgi:hypothetical protein
MIPLQKLLPAFARLERQLHELTGDHSSLIQGLAAEQKAAGFFGRAIPDPQPVPHFADLDHAWRSLHHRWHGMISWSGRIHFDWFNHMGDVHKDWDFNNLEPKPKLEQLVLESKRGFDMWSLGLEDLRKRLDGMTPREASVCSLLECYALLAQTIIGTASFPRELLWDNFRNHFEQIVGLCQKVIEQEVRESGTLSSTHSAPIVVQHRYAPNHGQDSASASHHALHPLTFDMGVCMILFHVATRCRDARVRLTTLKLLEDHPRLEGLWDGAIIAKIGRAVDAVERQGESLEAAAARGALAAEIPLSQRVLHMRGKPYMHSRRASLILYKAKDEEERDYITIVSTLDW